jgi:hypothetical protein
MWTGLTCTAWNLLIKLWVMKLSGPRSYGSVYSLCRLPSSNSLFYDIWRYDVANTVQIMRAVGDTFGRGIWKRTLLVLTHGNLAQTPPGSDYGEGWGVKVYWLRGEESGVMIKWLRGEESGVMVWWFSIAGSWELVVPSSMLTGAILVLF